MENSEQQEGNVWGATHRRDRPAASRKRKRSAKHQRRKGGGRFGVQVAAQQVPIRLGDQEQEQEEEPQSIDPVTDHAPKRSRVESTPSASSSSSSSSSSETPNGTPNGDQQAPASPSKHQLPDKHTYESITLELIEDINKNELTHLGPNAKHPKSNLVAAFQQYQGGEVTPGQVKALVWAAASASLDLPPPEPLLTSYEKLRQFVNSAYVCTSNMSSAQWDLVVYASFSGLIPLTVLWEHTGCHSWTYYGGMNRNIIRPAFHLTDVRIDSTPALEVDERRLMSVELEAATLVQAKLLSLDKENEQERETLEALAENWMSSIEELLHQRGGNKKEPLWVHGSSCKLTSEPESVINKYCQTFLENNSQERVDIVETLICFWMDPKHGANATRFREFPSMRSSLIATTNPQTLCKAALLAQRVTAEHQENLTKARQFADEIRSQARSDSASEDELAILTCLAFVGVVPLCKLGAWYKDVEEHVLVPVFDKLESIEPFHDYPLPLQILLETELHRAHELHAHAFQQDQDAAAANTNDCERTVLRKAWRNSLVGLLERQHDAWEHNVKAMNGYSVTSDYCVQCLIRSDRAAPHHGVPIARAITCSWVHHIAQKKQVAKLAAHAVYRFAATAWMSPRAYLSSNMHKTSTATEHTSICRPLLWIHCFDSDAGLLLWDPKPSGRASSSSLNNSEHPGAFAWMAKQPFCPATCPVAANLDAALMAQNAFPCLTYDTAKESVPLMEPRQWRARMKRAWTVRNHYVYPRFALKLAWLLHWRLQNLSPHPQVSEDSSDEEDRHGSAGNTESNGPLDHLQQLRKDSWPSTRVQGTVLHEWEIINLPHVFANLIDHSTLKALTKSRASNNANRSRSKTRVPREVKYLSVLEGKDTIDATKLFPYEATWWELGSVLFDREYSRCTADYRALRSRLKDLPFPWVPPSYSDDDDDLIDCRERWDTVTDKLLPSMIQLFLRNKSASVSTNTTHPTEQDCWPQTGIRPMPTDPWNDYADI